MLKPLLGFYFRIESCAGSQNHDLILLGGVDQADLISDEVLVSGQARWSLSRLGITRTIMLSTRCRDVRDPRQCF